MKIKLSAILLLAGALSVSAKGLSQQISLSVKNAPLKTVFSEIRKQTGYIVFYDNSLLQTSKPVTVDVRNGSLRELLKTTLYNQGLEFTMEDKTITITRKQPDADKETAPLPPVEITGRITDDKGTPLPGVSIQVKGTSKGTSTDAGGNYHITVSGPGDILVFTYLGYTAVEKPVNDQTTLNISLTASSLALSEVVAVGYGVQKKVNVTGAVATVSGEQLANRPAPTVTSALQGQMPGVTIQNPTGKPGSNSTTIRIRGIGSLNNSNPLVLIDGFEGDINTINAQDIENISVLKDAASAAIYGSRGANGVVLITTKSGQANKPVQISYNAYGGFQTPTRLPEYLGSPEYMTLMREAEANVGRPATFTDADIEKARNGSDPNYFANTNWIKEVYRSRAFQQNHNLSLQGGGKNVHYYMSYGYLDQDGNVTGDAFGTQRHNIRLKLGSKVLDRLTLDANVAYVDQKDREPSISAGSNTGLLYIALRNSPLVPPRFTNGEWGYGGGASNPVALAEDGGSFTLNSRQLTGNFSAKLDIMEGLSARVQYGTVINDWRSNRFTKKITYLYPETGLPWYSDMRLDQLAAQDSMTRYQSIIAQADYDKIIGKHTFHLLVGYSQEWAVNDQMLASRQGFVDDGLLSLNGGTLNQRNSASAYQWAIRSGFARLNYAYDNRYLLEANMRYDGSSRFASDRRFGLFPSLSLGWRVSEEAFIKQLLPASIESIKFRGSWGKLGNQYLDNNSFTNASLYPYLALYGNVPTQPLGGVLTSAFAQTVLSNPVITWESATMTDIGLDVDLLQGRLAFSADYFVKNTNDILLRVPLPDVIGLSEPSRNAGSVQNKGWEVQVTWQDKISDFNYGLSLNVADVRNKVTSLGGVPPTYADQIRQLGQPVDAFYGLVSEGLAQESDFKFDAATNTYTPLFPVIEGDASYIRPGDIRYKDLNGDGKIRLEDDRQVIGNPLPRFTYGARGNVGYKGIDLSFFLQGVGKADGYIKGVGRQAFTEAVAFPQKVHLDRWTPEHTNASYPRLTYQQGHNARFSTYWLENASYLRLKNIQVGYTLPKQLTNKAKIERLRIYFSADNLFTSTPFFSSYDPESPVSEGGFYPQVKTFVAGINLSFQ